MFSRGSSGPAQPLRDLPVKPDGTDMFVLYGAQSRATASCTLATWIEGK